MLLGPPIYLGLGIYHNRASVVSFLSSDSLLLAVAVTSSSTSFPRTDHHLVASTLLLLQAPPTTPEAGTPFPIASSGATSPRSSTTSRLTSSEGSQEPGGVEEGAGRLLRGGAGTRACRVARNGLYARTGLRRRERATRRGDDDRNAFFLLTFSCCLR